VLCLGAVYCTVVDYKPIIATVNSARGSWKAGLNERIMGYTKEEVKRLMGYIPNPDLKLPTITHKARPIPASFDASQYWKACTTIGTIYDQAECGSCWAFGCVEAVQDRFCIHSNGSVKVSLSFEDETCCAPCDGCEGGDPGTAWQYVVDSGLVTASCYPYTIPTCPPAQEPCLNFVATPNCTQTCTDSENWSDSLHYLDNVYYVSNVTSMQMEIMTNGPIEACFTVYSDFLTYKSGVYQYTTGDELGGHCIKIIGWGVENSLPYWLCNNSCTTYWGDVGQFKILRGSDECGIEDDVVAGIPKDSLLRAI